MSQFVVFVMVALASSAAIVRGGSQNAKILSDARYLSNGGQFGAAYTQGDGVEFKEEADADGNRRGSYSYVDPNGQRRTVTYTAGKDGFKATGDHLPSAPTPVPVVPVAKSAWVQPAAAVPNQWNQWNSAPAPVSAKQEDDGQWREEEHSAPKYDESNYDDGQWKQWSSDESSSSDDGGQWDPLWNVGAIPKLAAALSAQPKQAHWNQWNSIPTTAKWSQWTAAAPTAPPAYSVHQATGQVSLNRSPDGYSYTYSGN